MKIRGFGKVVFFSRTVAVDVCFLLIYRRLFFNVFSFRHVQANY
jgi:hypothetical protein